MPQVGKGQWENGSKIWVGQPALAKRRYPYLQKQDGKDRDIVRKKRNLKELPKSDLKQEARGPTHSLSVVL